MSWFKHSHGIERRPRDGAYGPPSIDSARLAKKKMICGSAHEIAEGVCRTQRLPKETPVGSKALHHVLGRLHVDLEGFQELRGHDVEADGQLQLDQGAWRQF